MGWTHPFLAILIVKCTGSALYRLVVWWLDECIRITMPMVEGYDVLTHAVFLQMFPWERSLNCTKAHGVSCSSHGGDDKWHIALEDWDIRTYTMLNKAHGCSSIMLQSLVDSKKEKINPLEIISELRIFHVCAWIPSNISCFILSGKQAVHFCLTDCGVWPSSWGRAWERGGGGKSSQWWSRSPALLNIHRGNHSRDSRWPRARGFLRRAGRGWGGDNGCKASD